MGYNNHNEIKNGTKGDGSMATKKIMQTRIDELEKQNDELTNECNRLRDEMRKLINAVSDKDKKIDELEEETYRKNRLIDEIYAKYDKACRTVTSKLKTKHNERGAGRHKSYTNEQLAQAQEWRKAGKSYAEIGEILGLSKTTVHRMLNQK